MQLDSYILPENVISINLHLQSAGELCYSAIVFQKVKGNYQIIELQKDTFEIDQIKQCISNYKTAKILLNITGKGILNRIIENNPDNLSQIIPGFNQKDYFFQESSIDEKKKLISMIKSKTLEGLLNDFQSRTNTSVVFVSIGVVSFVENSSMIYSLGQKINQFVFRDLLLELEPDGLLNVSPRNLELVPTYIKIEENQLTEELLPCFTQLLYFIQSIKNVSSAVLPTPIDKTFTSWYTDSKLKVYGSVVLLISFVVLIINFLFSASLEEENSVLKYQQKRNGNILSQIDSLEKKLKTNERIISYLGINKPSLMAYYADQIASTVPNGIQLTQLQICPPINNNNKTEFEFNTNKITINGTCNGALLLNNWMKLLNKLDWVERVELNNYAKQENKFVGVFTVLIEIK